MAFDGQLLNKPSGPERAIGDALLVFYGGVYVPPPLEPVLSPNGDGVAERQRLAYKVVRPSNVNVAPARPRRRPALLLRRARRRRGRTRSTGRASGPTAPRSSRAAGAGWSPRPTTPVPASTAERAFQLNRTLGFATPVAPALAVPRAAAASGRDLQARPRGHGHAADRDRLRRRSSATLPKIRAAAGRPPGRLGRPHRRGARRLLGQLRRRGDGDERARLGHAAVRPSRSDDGSNLETQWLARLSLTHTITSFVGRPRHLRRLRPDDDRRRLPGCERARDGLRRARWRAGRSPAAR